MGLPTIGLPRPTGRPIALFSTGDHFYQAYRPIQKAYRPTRPTEGWEPMGEGGFNLLFCVLKYVGAYLVRYWMLDHSRSVLFYVTCVCSV